MSFQKIICKFCGSYIFQKSLEKLWYKVILLMNMYRILYICISRNLHNVYKYIVHIYEGKNVWIRNGWMKVFLPQNFFSRDYVDVLDCNGSKGRRGYKTYVAICIPHIRPSLTILSLSISPSSYFSTIYSRFHQSRVGRKSKGLKRSNSNSVPTTVSWKPTWRALFFI